MITGFALSSLVEFSGLLVAVFGAFGTILVGFYKYAQAREKDFELSRKNQSEAFDKSIEKLTVALTQNVEAHKEVAAAMNKSAEEAETRNGHLAEISQQNADRIVREIKKIKVNQNIKDQNVEHQHVESRD